MTCRPNRPAAAGRRSSASSSGRSAESVWRPQEVPHAKNVLHFLPQCSMEMRLLIACCRAESLWRVVYRHEEDPSMRGLPLTMASELGS